MKALVFHKPKDVRVENVPDPKIEDPRDVVIRITHRLPLDEAPHGYDIFNKKEDNCVKVVLKL